MRGQVSRRFATMRLSQYIWRAAFRRRTPVYLQGAAAMGDDDSELGRRIGFLRVHAVTAISFRRYEDDARHVRCPLARASIF